MFHVNVMETATPGAFVFWGEASYGRVTGRPIWRDDPDELWIPVKTATGLDMLVEADTIWYVTRVTPAD